MGSVQTEVLSTVHLDTQIEYSAGLIRYSDTQTGKQTDIFRYTNGQTNGHTFGYTNKILGRTNKISGHKQANKRTYIWIHK